MVAIMWFAALVMTSAAVVARATPLGLHPIALRGYIGAASSYRCQGGGVVAADPPPRIHLVGGQAQSCGFFLMPGIARPHTEACWRTLWGADASPRSRPPSANASRGRLRLGGKFLAPSPRLPRHNHHLIQRRSATAGGTQGDLAMPTLGETCILP